MSQRNLQPEQPGTVSGPSSNDYNRARIQKAKSPSCNLCRRRKIKCDRASPCSNCVRCGAVCVSPAPSGVPRGRQGGRRKHDSELLNRLAKLENLVKQLEGGAAVPKSLEPTPSTAHPVGTVSDISDDRGSKRPPLRPDSKAPKAGLERYLGVGLWNNLSEEIYGMREVLDQPSDDEDDQDELTPNSTPPGLTLPQESDFVMSAPDVYFDRRAALEHPTRSQIHTFYSLFMTNVDPAVKLLHGPSLRRYLIEETGELECSPGPKGWEALKSAIYYITTTSLTPDECLQKLGEEKMLLLSRFRSNTECAFSRADLVNSEDISTLQAYVFYLDFDLATDRVMQLAVRSNENSRRTWTLTSLAIRIAHALGLHQERYGGEFSAPPRPFEREMRRRLWWQICILDTQTSIDRGSDPMIPTNSFTTKFPLNVNDKDLAPNDPHEVRPHEAYTDMTFCLVCLESFGVGRRLNYVSADELNRSQEKTDDPWAQRREIVTACQRRIEEKYLQYCDVTVPTQHYTVLVADIIIATMWLWTYRPLHRHPDSSTLVQIPTPGILHLAVEVVEKAIQVSAAELYRWNSSMWVQWHALAVMIAELCVQTEGQTVERAWDVVYVAFEETARHVAESNKGRLWRPIKKLMNKAEAVRRRKLGDDAANLGSLPPTGPVPSQSQFNPPTNPNRSDLNMTDLDVGLNLPGDNAGPAPQIPIDMASIGPSSMLNWDVWGPPGPSDYLACDSAINQTAWNNWETFIDDFQANSTFPL